MSTKERIVVAMSGGVDSSVAAALLCEQGYDVVGLFMRNGVVAGEAAVRGKQGCCSLDDSMDGRRVADLLDIPFYVVNFSAEFDRIIDYFVNEYEQGRTPNPCVQCNRWLKFGRLLEYADDIGASAVATGHYGRVVRRDDRLAVARPADDSKDQSYVLFPLEQHQLERTRLPLGDLTKPEVRDIARRFNLPVMNKPDSQEICFVPDNRYGNVLSARNPGSIQRGPLVDTSGRVVGEHDGHQLYTVGQRKGLGGGFSAPMYVVETHPETNTVVVGGEGDLLSRSLVLGEVCWSGIPGIEPGMSVEGEIQVRYQSVAVPAVATVEPGNVVHVEFSQPIRAVTPGQAAVFYSEDVVQFGGFIDKARRETALR